MDKLTINASFHKITTTECIKTTVVTATGHSTSKTPLHRGRPLGHYAQWTRASGGSLHRAATNFLFQAALP